MEAKHTPGPWHVDELSIGTVEAADGTVVGQTFQVEPLRADFNQTVRRANACLFAAAPELLESVRNLAQIVYTQNGNLHDDINTLLAQAKAAIAKATGSAQ